MPGMACNSSGRHLVSESLPVSLRFDSVGPPGEQKLEARIKPCPVQLLKGDDEYVHDMRLLQEI